MADKVANRLDRPGKPILAILVAVLVLSFGDAVVKLASADFSLWQIWALRALFALPFLLIIIRLQFRPISLVPQVFGWTAVRSLLLTGNWFFYYAALPNVPLAVAAAGYYTIPLFIALLAGTFGGERIGRRVWLAVIFGFLGVLVMLRPDAGGANVYALLPVVAAVFYASAMVLTRTKCAAEEPLVLSLALNVTFAVFGLLASGFLFIVDPVVSADAPYRFLVQEWTPVGPKEWLVIVVLAIAIVIGSVLAAFAYQNGQASIIGTFDYAYLAFAVLWGVVIFFEIPDVLTVAGMFMIVAAGLIVAQR